MFHCLHITCTSINSTPHYHTAKCFNRLGYLCSVIILEIIYFYFFPVSSAFWWPDRVSSRCRQQVKQFNTHDIQWKIMKPFKNEELTILAWLFQSFLSLCCVGGGSSTWNETKQGSAGPEVSQLYIKQDLKKLFLIWRPRKLYLDF